MLSFRSCKSEAPECEVFLKEDFFFFLITLFQASNDRAENLHCNEPPQNVCIKSRVYWAVMNNVYCICGGSFSVLLMGTWCWRGTLSWVCYNVSFPFPFSFLYIIIEPFCTSVVLQPGWSDPSLSNMTTSLHFVLLTLHLTHSFASIFNSSPISMVHLSLPDIFFF